MASSLNPSDIKKIKDTSAGDDQINAAIEVANAVRTDELSSQGLTDSRLTLIEKYLAAHFLHVFDPEAEEIRDRGIGVDAVLSGETGMFLKATHHGQTAMWLDNSGTLAELEQERQKGKATIAAVSELEDR